MEPHKHHEADNNIGSQAYTRIRKAVGYCGFVIPLLCLSLSLTRSCYRTVLPSISHYYYTLIGDVFVGVLFALGLFLVLYKSVFTIEKLRRQENRYTNLSGICAMLVAFIPTDPDGGNCYHIGLSAGTYHEVFGLLGHLHLPAAALMLIIFGVIAYHYFPRNWVTGIPDSSNKKLYRLCAWIIFVSIFILILYFADGKFLDGKYLAWMDSIRIIFVLECVSVMAFAVSWLKKGRAADAIKEVYVEMKSMVKP